MNYPGHGKCQTITSQPGSELFSHEVLVNQIDKISVKFVTYQKFVIVHGIVICQFGIICRLDKKIFKQCQLFMYTNVLIIITNK